MLDHAGEGVGRELLAVVPHLARFYVRHPLSANAYRVRGAGFRKARHLHAEIFLSGLYMVAARQGAEFVHAPPRHCLILGGESVVGRGIINQKLSDRPIQ